MSASDKYSEGGRLNPRKFKPEKKLTPVKETPATKASNAIFYAAFGIVVLAILCLLATNTSFFVDIGKIF